MLATVFQGTSFCSEEFSSKYHYKSPTFDYKILEPPNNGAYNSLHMCPSLFLRRPSSYSTTRCHRLRHRTALDQSKKTARSKRGTSAPHSKHRSSQGRPTGLTVGLVVAGLTTGLKGLTTVGLVNIPAMGVPKVEIDPDMSVLCGALRVIRSAFSGRVRRSDSRTYLELDAASARTPLTGNMMRLSVFLVSAFVDVPPAIVLPSIIESPAGPRTFRMEARRTTHLELDARALSTGNRMMLSLTLQVLDVSGFLRILNARRRMLLGTRLTVFVSSQLYNSRA